MPTILISTLHRIADLFPENHMAFRRHFPCLMEQFEQDHPVRLSLRNQVWLDTLVEGLSYPRCIHCYLPVSGKGNVCGCFANIDQFQPYQQEYQMLLQRTHALDMAVKTVIERPFRQLRNAYGFGSGLLSGLNVVTAGLPVMALSVTISALFLPSLVLGGYVYYRGRREESAMNADIEAEAMARKVNLFIKHRESVQLRCQSKHLPDCLRVLPLQSPTAKPYSKEKRSLLGNPLGHFVGASLTMLGSMSILIKLSLLPLILGGSLTIAWGVAAVTAIATGCYFAYSRFRCLQSKHKLDDASNTVAAHVQDIEKLTHNINDYDRIRIQDKLSKLERTCQSRHEARLCNEPRISRLFKPVLRSPKKSILAAANSDGAAANHYNFRL